MASYLSYHFKNVARSLYDEFLRKEKTIKALTNFVLVTNIPSPYRVYFFNELYKKIGDTFCVFYCAQIESDREWDLPNIKHPHVFLRTKKHGANLYWWSNIWSELKKLKPGTVVTAGFTPVMLRAFLYTRVFNLKHVVFTDAWILTVQSLSYLHRFIRRIVFKRSTSFICIGKKGAAFLKSYGCREERIFISPIVIDTEKYFEVKAKKKEYDVVFSGQFIERKMPLFFCDVMALLKKKYPNLNVLLLGNGPLLNKSISVLKKNKINFYSPGFIQPELLNKFYTASKILCFPSRLDHWGVVANEACAAGLPVLTTENTGAATDLILNNYNGFVLQADAKIWCDKLYELLLDRNKLFIFSSNSFKQIKKFNKEIAISNFLKAIY